MRHPRFFTVTLYVGLLLACGCDALSGPRRSPPKAAEPVAESAASTAPAAQKADSASARDDGAVPAASGLAGSDNQGVPRSAVAAAPLKETSPDASAGTPESRAMTDEAVSVRLSAGVALPQTLPAGTAMGFSVDYEFQSGGPQPSYRYVWIIRAAGAAEPWESAVPLEPQGTLQTFVLPWRPEQGPFEAELVEVRPDGSRRRISHPVPLKASDW